MAYIKINETNRITAASYNYHCGSDEIETVIPEEIQLQDIHDYLYVDGEYIYEPLPVVIDNAARIAELKQKLANTDYIIIKITEGVATWEEYPEIKEQRQVWRDEINELEQNAILNA